MSGIDLSAVHCSLACVAALGSYLPFAAALIMGVLGFLHLAYTLHDFGTRPRYFSPKNAALLEGMRRTRTSIAPRGRDYWSGILGFHLSHSLGILMYSGLVVLAACYI